MPTYLISTVSGGYFIRQLAIIQQIMSTGVTIDAYFGNSGGAIANLLSMKYTNTTQSVLRVLNALRPEMFATPWVQAGGLQIFSPLISLFSNSLFDDSKGVLQILKTFYTKEELQSQEMWIGKYDAHANFNLVMGTMQEGQSRFTNINSADNKRYFEDMTGTFNIEYANGNFETISKYIEATSNIPGFKPPTDGKFIDGGVGSASLGTIFINLFKEDFDVNENLIMFYNQGRQYIDEDIETMSTRRHWMIQMSKMGQWLINFRILTEKQMLFEAWLSMIGKTFTEVTFESMSLARFSAFINDGTNRHMFVTTYTDKGDKINIVNFKYKDLEKSYKDALNSTKYDVFHSTRGV
jgi:hypothetical protein